MKRICIAIAATLALPALATVNVNIAQQSELQGVKGMTPSKAKAVIEHRNQNGPFQSLDELVQVIDAPTLEKARPQLALSGDAFTPPARPEKAEKARTKAKKAD